VFPGQLGRQVSWDEAKLDQYLVDPNAMIKGTTKTFAGDKNDAGRADLFVSLATLK
jgi:cytochrome c